MKSFASGPGVRFRSVMISSEKRMFAGNLIGSIFSPTRLEASRATELGSNPTKPPPAISVIVSWIDRLSNPWLRRLDAAAVKDFGNQRAGRTVVRRQYPGLRGQIGKLDPAPPGPLAVLSRNRDERLLEQGFIDHLILGRPPRHTADQQFDFTRQQLAELHGRGVDVHDPQLHAGKSMQERLRYRRQDAGHDDLGPSDSELSGGRVGKKLDLFQSPAHFIEDIRAALRAALLRKQ